MASGTPVIASDVGGLSFTVVDGETGYLVEQENHFLLAERVHTLLKNPELREQMGAQAALHAQQFSWSNIASRITGVYKEIAQSHKAAETACA